MHFISGTYNCLTDIGKKREVNEDFASGKVNAFGQLLLLVSDGMGGRNKGDYASSYLGNNLLDEFINVKRGFKSINQVKSWLYKKINKLNRDIYSKSHSEIEYENMGATLTAAIIFKDQVVVAQVGDSRLYKIDEDGNLVQLTVDQSYVQYLNHQNKISANEMTSHKERHKLTNAIGVRYNANVDLLSFPYSKEKLLLCSDGLYNNVPFNTIKSILKGDDSPSRKCQQLIAFGNNNGGSDNMAVIIWEAN